MTVKITLNTGEIINNLESSIPESEIFSELVFNTSMTGYQEIFTDPSYLGQTLVMTYPLIGNYGLDNNVNQSEKPKISALITKECSQNIINWLKYYNIPVISAADTRDLTIKIRNGANKCAISINDKDINEVSNFALDTYKIISENIEKNPVIINGSSGKKVLIINCGIKQGMITNILKYNHTVHIIPFYEDIVEYAKSFSPDIIFLSNGAGDPRDLTKLCENIKAIIGKYRIRGICMGHQILSLALGGKVYKMQFGHRGANQPVKNLLTGKCFLTSQNHSYAADISSFSSDTQISYINLNDGSVEGIVNKKYDIESVQFHPESSPGTNDAIFIFDDWFGSL